MRISFVWFDLGYTLLYMPRERSCGELLAALGFPRPLDRLEREFHLVDKRFMRERPGVFGHDPETYMPWFLGELFWRLRVRADLGAAWARLKELQRASHPCWLPFEGVAEALEGLARRGYRLGVISNWDASACELLGSHRLAPYFEHVVISSEVGCEKPDPGIFELAMAKAGVAAAECLYVGDNYYVDTAGARAVGMPSLVVNRFGTLGVEEIADVPIIAHVRDVATWLDGTGV